MKISMINDTDYKIYYYEKTINSDEINDLLKRIQKKIKLSGFYKVTAIVKKIGLFLELKKINNDFYKNVVELKIEIKDDPVYYQTTDYFIIKDMPDIGYKDGMYYCIVDDSFDEVLEKVEFGDFVFGSNISR